MTIKNFTNYAYQLVIVIPWLAGLTTHESASADLELYSSAAARRSKWDERRSQIIIMQPHPHVDMT